MATLRDKGDRIIVSLFDLLVLIALLAGPAHPYAIARQCEVDYGSRSKVSNGTLFKSLKSLVLLGLINEIEKPSGRQYELSWHGRLIVEHEIKKLDNLTGAARERLQNKVKAPLKGL